MKQSTLNNIKQAVNQLIKNNIKLTTEVLSKEAHTSKRTVTEFFKMFPKESFNKYYKNGTANNSTILKSADENGTIQIGTEEHFDVMTDEGFINQLNRLYTKGNINKEYYLQQVELMKNTYSKMYERIKEKLLMN